MITGVFGLTGAGKSSFLSWCAMRAQKGKSLRIGFIPAGGVYLQDMRSKDYERIYSNFPILGCYPYSFDDLGVYDFHDCLILCDEIMMLCDSRNFKNYPEHIKYFMSHHRHYNVDFIWCSQSYNDTDLRIRNLSKQFLKMEKIGGSTRITPIIHKFDVRGGKIEDGYYTGGILASKTINRRKVYHMFDTHTKKSFPPIPDTINLWDLENGQDTFDGITKHIASMQKEKEKDNEMPPT